MLFWPRETYEGALAGLELWATILVPSLLPFFILSEVLFNLGFVTMLGILLEPLMRPLFKLPGSASFVVVMGFTAGFPMGALLTRRLVEEGLCTIGEGERLVAFTNNSSPLFILAAVGAGLFSNPQLGLILALAHYLSNILLGILLGLGAARRNKEAMNRLPGTCALPGRPLADCLAALFAAERNRLPWGELLGRAVRKGIDSITLIGGFVIFFAVVIRLLKTSSLLTIAGSALDRFLALAAVTPGFGAACTTGFWEISLGLQELSHISHDFTATAVAASVILAWSGISIQAQVVSVLAASGIKAGKYYGGRIIQSLLAGLFAYTFASFVEYWPFIRCPAVLADFSSILIQTLLVGGLLPIACFAMLVSLRLIGKKKG